MRAVIHDRNEPHELARTTRRRARRPTSARADDAAALENAKARYLGKTGQLTELLKGLGKLAAGAAQGAGRADQRRQGADRGGADGAPRRARRRASSQARLNAEALDVTLPGRGRGSGGMHPVMRTWERIEAIFRSIGFDVADGPEIETDWYNFTALNNPENHPARSMQDTFYVDGKDETASRCCCAPHTSPMQVRYARTHTAADQGDRAGPHLSRRQRRDALADVPPGRGPVDRRGRQLRRPEGRVH